RIGIPEIARINEFATEGTTPDFTLYLDVDSDTGLRRIQENRAHQYDRLDSEGLEFHQRVRHAYLKLAEENPVRIHKIDARMGLQEVVESSYSAIVESYPAYFKSI
ncbi:dTMP kinase, partial [Listeria monocytogenes]|nr:dTMP kinase [Listeria monocytogenes]